MNTDISSAIPMLAVHNANKAIEFYKNVFHAVEVNRMVTSDGKIEHSEVKVGNARIMIADEFPGHNRAAKSLGGTPVIMYLYVDNVDDVVQRALLEGTTLLRPIEDLPHGDRVGKIEDPFGHVWLVATPINQQITQVRVVFSAGTTNGSIVKNRSVPANVVLPHIFYQNVANALAWLTTTFGFIEYYRYGIVDGQISGSQMHLGDAWIMLKSARAGTATPQKLGFSTQYLTVFVDDVDAHFERAKSAGAKIVEDLNETVYGERQYVVEDLEGHNWLFSKHIRDVGPNEWGATIATEL